MQGEVGRSESRRLWLTFAGASLLAVVAGVLVARAHGAATTTLILNLAAWAVGAGLAAGLARMGRRWSGVWPIVTLAALALTLVSPGLSDVHRWVSLGPVRLNVAMLLLPLALTACAASALKSPIRLIFPVAAAAILALQPDLSQAVALAGAAIVLLARAKGPFVLRLAAALAIAGALVATGARPDPLAPVPTVEGIVLLAWAMSPAMAALAVIALAGAVLAPLAAARSTAPAVGAAATTLTVYLALSALSPAYGAFPVPLVGMGVSPILGAWLGIGVLMGLTRAAGR